ncbi:MAG: hypothetical protein ACT4OI_08130 [Methanobacteriota archaeon]
MRDEGPSIARRFGEPGTRRADTSEGPEDDRGGPSATREAVLAALTTASDHCALARTVGADPVEAESLLAEARRAAELEDFPAAWDLAKRAERLAMRGQQEQIQKAIRLRDAQIERAQAIVAAGEPVVQEAESYGIDVAESRTLLRQARDVLAKGDYVTGMIFAQNAEEAIARLEPRLDEERRTRGIQKPTQGVCGVCASRRLHFYDNGWGRCLACGGTFRWRSASGVLETLRGLLGT